MNRGESEGENGEGGKTTSHPQVLGGETTRLLEIERERLHALN